MSPSKPERSVPSWCISLYFPRTGGHLRPPRERRWRGALQRQARGLPARCAFRPLQAHISILFFPGFPALLSPAGILPFRPITCQRKKIRYLAQVLFSAYLVKRPSTTEFSE